MPGIVSTEGMKKELSITLRLLLQSYGQTRTYEKTRKVTSNTHIKIEGMSLKQQLTLMGLCISFFAMQKWLLD